MSKVSRQLPLTETLHASNGPVLAARSRFRGGGQFVLFPLAGLGRRLAGKLPVHGVWREVGAVRPADRAELVHCHLTEDRLVAQGLEHFAVKFAGEVYRACNPVLDFAAALHQRPQLLACPLGCGYPLHRGAPSSRPVAKPDLVSFAYQARVHPNPFSSKLRTSPSSKAACQELDRSEIKPCLATGDGPLKVPCQPPIAAKPSEGPLDHPAP